MMRDIRKVVAMGLQREGFGVDSSCDPVEVAANYQPGSYDLLLLDIRMPRMNGLNCTAKSGQRTRIYAFVS